MNLNKASPVLVLLTSFGALMPFTDVHGATAAGSMSAEIVSGIAIAPTAVLDFGQCVASGSMGKVVMTPSGARLCAGGVSLGNAGTASPGSFQVAGTTNTTYSITLPGSVAIVNGKETMTVDQFTSNPMPAGSLNSLGFQLLSIGATLNVGAEQHHGVYVGTYEVTVAYN